MGGCASGRDERKTTTANGGSGSLTGGSAAIDPYDSQEIPPEALEFPEPPGLDLGPVGESGPAATPPADAAKVPEQAPRPAPDPEVEPDIPDLTGSIPILPPLLEPRGREGLVELVDRNDVVDKFEMPTRMETTRFIYSRHRIFPDFKQVVFLFDVQGKLERVDLFPARPIDRGQVIQRYGGGNRSRISKGYEILIYPRLHLTFFLRTATNQVHSIRIKK